MVCFGNAAAQSFEIVDIKPGIGGSSPTQLTVFDGTLYFSASTDSTGTELFESDGTVNGTQSVEDLVPGSGSSSPKAWRRAENAANESFVSNGTHFYFAARSPSEEFVWRTDGTTLERVSGGGMHDSSPQPRDFIKGQGDRVYWVADDTSGARRLFYTSGTSASMVGNFIPEDHPYPDSFQVIGDRLYTSGYAPATGYELYYVDNNSSNAVLVTDLYPGSDYGLPRDFALGPNQQLLFSGRTPASGIELMITDGTEAGTRVVKDIMPGSLSSTPGQLIRLPNGNVLFSAEHETRGREVWVTDGT